MPLPRRMQAALTGSLVAPQATRLNPAGKARRAKAQPIVRGGAVLGPGGRAAVTAAPVRQGGGGAGGTATAAAATGQWSPDNPYAKLINQYQTGIPTTQSLLGTARKAVESELSPALEALRQDSLLEQRQLGQQSVRSQEFAKALAQMNLAQNQQLQQNYGNTAQFLGTLGTNLTGQVAQDWQAQVAAQQAAVNQATGNLAGATVEPGYNLPGLASTAQYTGVTLPAASLAQQALTAQSGLQAQSTADVMNVGNLAQQYLAKLSDEQAQLGSERAKLIAQRPALVEKALEGLRTGREEKMGSLVDLIGGASKFESERAKSATDLYTAQQKAASDQQKNIVSLMNAKTRQGDLSFKQKFNYAKLKTDAWFKTMAENRQRVTASAYNNYLAGQLELGGARLDSTTRLGLMNIAQNAVDASNLQGYRQATLNQNEQKIANTFATQYGRLVNQQQRDAWTRKVQAAGMYVNPYTNQIEKIPPGTMIGPQGIPVDATPSMGAAGRPPDIAKTGAFLQGMDEAIRTQMGISKLAPGGTKKMTKAQVTKWLNDRYRSIFLMSYPGMEQQFGQMVNSIATSIANKKPTPSPNIVGSTNPNLTDPSAATGGLGNVVPGFTTDPWMQPPTAYNPYALSPYDPRAKYNPANTATYPGMLAQW
jgi:hypothetical protein